MKGKRSLLQILKAMYKVIAKGHPFFSKPGRGDVYIPEGFFVYVDAQYQRDNQALADAVRREFGLSSDCYVETTHWEWIQM